LDEGEQRGLEKGLKEGKLEGMRQTMVSIVRVRFPRLVSLVTTRAAQIDDPGALEDLVVKISTASKAQEARRFLLGEDEGQQSQRHDRATRKE
jgi:flagellar biosynthesis/type III secretory pathway protein FliH